MALKQYIKVNGREYVLSTILYDPFNKQTLYYVMGESEPFSDLKDEIEFLDLRRDF